MMRPKNLITTIYIDDYEEKIAGKLEKIKGFLDERDVILSELSEKKRSFILKRREGIKDFLDSRDYYPAKSYDSGKIYESFYCEKNSHQLRLCLFDFILIIITSGDSFTQYKINLLVHNDDERFEQTQAIQGKEGRIGFLNLKEMTEDFLDEEVNKLENNLKILKHRLNTFKEEYLIYNYEDIYGIGLNEVLNKVLNETKL